MSSLENYKLIHTNEFQNIKNETFVIEGTPLKKEGKLFLKEVLDLSSMEISLNILKPDEEIPFFHKHKKNEEVYVIIKGKAQFIIDEEIIDLQEGSIIKIKPDGARHYKNSSSKEELVIMIIQAKENSLNSKTIEDGYIVD
ncbi:cupin domain-containing protein [Arcobacter sp. LA11]|uniref:cupin domain-containing protein n=1 Tax=Arcobacter sp. LA11 TaxID=1898176 RepID=UPI00093272F1|nr:cupin domain-containing protein [Arcobacter sp. LA11]